MRFSLGLALGLLLPASVWASPNAVEPRYANEEALSRYAQGRLLEERGARPEALDEYFRALFLDTGAEDVARRVSEVSGQMGDPGRSLEFAQRALEMAPGNARALWLKGAALINLGRDGEALEPLQTAVGIDSDRVEYVRTLARAAERLERFDLVVTSYRRVVWLDDEDGEAWFQLAAAEARLGQFGAADTAMASAADLNPLRPGLFFLQGWIAEGLGRFDDAQKDYRQHLEIHQDDQATRRRLTLLLARQNRFREALEQAHRLAVARPEDLDLRHLEADLSFRAGASSEGMRLVDRMGKDFPNNLEALSVRVSLLAGNGKAKQAVGEADRWLAAHPDDLRARLVTARAHELGGDAAGAIRHLQQAVDQAPDSLAPRVLLARAYDSAGRPREAEPVWVETQHRFPSLSSVAFDLALCREKIGDLGGAETALRDVLRREPDNPTALNFLGYLFADHNRNLDEAVDLIRRALTFEPENSAFMDSLGWAYYRLGRLPEARVSLEKALVLSGGDPVIHEHLGDVYKDMRLKDLARDQYRKSLSYDRSNERVRAKLSSIR